MNEFIDGTALNFGSEIRGMELVEDEITLGGHTIPAGSVLLTLNNDGSTVGDNSVAVNSEDIFYLTVTQTGSSPVADATLLLDGGDVNLDSSQEHLQALTLTTAVSAEAAKIPIAHWKLDETSGITAVDSEGGHHGTLTNGPTWDSGNIDGALAFDGTDDYVDLTSDAALDDVFLGGATVTAWIYLDGWGENAYGRVLDKSSAVSDNRDGWMIGTDGGNQSIAFAQGFSSIRGFWRPQNNTVNLNEWVHYAIVYDASSEANDPVIYINGVAQTSLVKIAPSGTICSDADIALRMGNHAQDTSRSFDGKLDDVRIYDQALTAAEISELFTAGGGGGGGSNPPPVDTGCSGTFRDEFKARNWSGSDGSIDWSSSPWVETGESDGATAGDVQVLNDQSDYQLRLQDNDNGGEGVEREMNLSGANFAILTFNYRRKNLDNVNDYVVISVSKDGGDYAEVVTINGQSVATDDSYQTFSQNISSYISANTKIRLLTSSKMGGADEIFFDNIQVQCGTLEVIPIDPIDPIPIDPPPAVM